MMMHMTFLPSSHVYLSVLQIAHYISIHSLLRRSPTLVLDDGRARSSVIDATCFQQGDYVIRITRRAVFFL